MDPSIPHENLLTGSNTYCIDQHQLSFHYYKNFIIIITFNSTLHVMDLGGGGGGPGLQRGDHATLME